MDAALTYRKKILYVIESAIANLQKNEQVVNNLNVFPVPDGDTGSNMLSTVINAWNYIPETAISPKEIFAAFSRGALLGARGNSGVITSQIIKGFFEIIKKYSDSQDNFILNDYILKEMFTSAKEYAYASVATPVEGTILSVTKALSDRFPASNNSNFTKSFLDVLKIVDDATENTINQLAVLKESNVVDSGAKGLFFLYQGALLALQEKGYKLILNASQNNQKELNNKYANPKNNIGYCTEFILTLKKPKSFNRNRFLDFLNSEGDSIVLIVEDDILKVHVHAKHPGVIFNRAQKYGEFSLIKADNMSLQAADAGHHVEGNEFKIIKSKMIDNELGIIAVSSGTGLDQFFKELGVDSIISGGQTMNPSIEDFQLAIKKLPYKNILLLPNNSNIILAVEKVKELVNDRKIYVLPTKTLAQGIVALYNINKKMIDFNNYSAEILSEINQISEGQITAAIKDTTVNKINIKKNDYIIIKGREIIDASTSLFESWKKLLIKIINDDSSIVTIFFNEHVTTDIRQQFKDFIAQNYPDLEIELKFGGQNVYDLIIFGEK